MMRGCQPLVIAALLALQAGGAWAQVGAACRPGGTTAEVNACAVQDFQAADRARITSPYSTAMVVSAA